MRFDRVLRLFGTTSLFVCALSAEAAPYRDVSAVIHCFQYKQDGTVFEVGTSKQRLRDGPGNDADGTHPLNELSMGRTYDGRFVEISFELQRRVGQDMGLMSATLRVGTDPSVDYGTLLAGSRVDFLNFPDLGTATLPGALKKTFKISTQYPARDAPEADVHCHVRAAYIQ